MLLGFQQRFEPMILDGSKTHTIRGERKRLPKIGETLHCCYVNPRQKSMRLLGRWPCAKVESIQLRIAGRDNDGWVRRLEIYVSEVHLNFDEASALAWRDGFRPEGSTSGDPGDSLREMSRFWTSQFNTPRHWKAGFRGNVWDGDLIHWRFTPLLESGKGKS